MNTPKQLTIEHLAAYLPYDVGSKWDKYPRKRFKLHGVLYGKPWLIDSSSCTEKAQIHDIKLILRPLSDLTKEITHNGEAFVPILRIEEMGYRIYRLTLDGIGDLSEPHRVTRKLHSWHFDTFGLIDANLAIDINTINQ